MMTRCNRRQICTLFILAWITGAMLMACSSAGGGGGETTDGGGEATESPAISGDAQKGHIIGAEILNAAGQPIGTTSTTPSSLGQFQDVTEAEVAPFEILTVRGSNGAIDTLDDTLDADDPSFEGEFRVVFNSPSVTRANPLTSIVAERFTQLRRNGLSPELALSTAQQEVATLFTIRPADIRSDMLMPGNEAVRLHHERVQVIVELARAAGATAQEPFIAMAGALDSPPSSDLITTLVSAVANSSAAAPSLLLIDSTIIASLKRSLPEVTDGSNNARQMVDVQRALQAALTTIRLNGGILDATTILSVTDAMAQGADANAPVADAGPPELTIKTGTTVTLDGSGSQEPAGRTLTFTWTGPTGATLQDVNRQIALFTADQPGRFEFVLTVDNGIKRRRDTVIIIVGDNQAPVADAGQGLIARLMSPVHLSGTASSDPDGDVLSFNWEILQAPPNSSVQLSNANTSTARFTADTEGEYSLRLTVSDGTAMSHDDVSVMLDADGDGLIGQADPDRDGDGVFNTDDLFPDNPGEFGDQDADGQGDFADVDEDGDGVEDLADAFPFDPTLTDLPTVVETGFNNNPGDATPTNLAPPFRLSGAIEANQDTDVYRFTVLAGQSLTAVARTGLAAFHPVLGILDSTGTTISTVVPNLSETSGIRAAVSFVALIDGEYFISVDDLNTRGMSDFTYDLDIFVDQDLDAVADTTERALGLNPLTPDSDRDGLFDAAELFVFDRDGRHLPDRDGDTIPNWLDIDSDGDLLTDTLETSADIDGDNLGNFVDLDADGNEIPDIDEAGLNLTRPLDSDLDSFADFVDLDDDDDGIPDILDQNRTTPIQQADLTDPNAIFLSRLFVETPAGNIIAGAARNGDILRLNGRNLAPLAAENLVVFETLLGTTTVVATSSDNDGLTVPVPALTTNAIVYVVANNVKSNAVPLLWIPDQAPILFELTTSIVSVGQNVTLSGLNLNGAASINIGGIGVSPTSSHDTSIEFIVPTDTPGGLLSVTTALGGSNSLELFIRNDKTVQVQPPAASTVGPQHLTVGAGILNLTRLDSLGTTTIGIPAAGASFISAFLTTPDDIPVGTFLKALALPQDTVITMDVTSTAVALLFETLTPATTDLDLLQTIRTQTTTLPEVTELANVLDTGIARDPLFLRNRNRDLDVAALEQSALRAFTDVINSVITNPSTQLAKVEPPDIIEVTPDDFFDPISVLEITNSQLSFITNGLLGKEDRTGFVEVVNDSGLPLSGRFIDQRTGMFSHIHVQSPQDTARIVPKQGTVYNLNGGFFGAGRKQDFFQPNFRDARVEILAPASNGLDPSELTPRERQALTALAVRVMVDGINDSITAFIAGLKTTELVPTDTIAANMPLVFWQHFGTVAEISALILNGDPLAALKLMATTLQTDFELTICTLGTGANFVRSFVTDPDVDPFAFCTKFGESPSLGPISSAIIDIILAQATKFFTNPTTLGESVALGLLENVLNPLNTLITAASGINAATRAGGALFDMAVMRGKTVFDVTYPLTVDRVLPEVVKAENKPIDLTLSGQGFAPWPNRVNGNPEILLQDTESGAELFLAGRDIPFNGRKMRVTIPAAFAKDMKGPLRVTAFNADFVAPKADEPEVLIQVTTVLEITALTPSKGGPGTTVMISGAGFSENALENTVLFTTENGTTAGTIITASSSALSVQVPVGVVTGNVIVQVEQETSNPLLFTATSAQVTITFGDNGSLLDDQFGLWVDGRPQSLMSEPVRSVSVTLDLPGPRHTVELRSIAAPDGIGTYFIAFDGPLMLLPGSEALSGSDLDSNGDPTKLFFLELDGSATNVRRIAGRPVVWKE